MSCLDGRTVKIGGKYVAAASISKSNGWIGELEDPMGDEVLSREGQSEFLERMVEKAADRST